MLELLNKYKQLPENLRLAMAKPEITAALQTLEAKYQVSLAAVVMRVMVKELPPEAFLGYFTDELNLPWSKAKELATDLKRSVFYEVAGYLGLEMAPPPPNIPSFKEESVAVTETDPIADAIMRSRLTFSSRQLSQRATAIATTYLKGVRSRLDSKDALTKAVDSGGVGLTTVQADRFLDCLDGKEPASSPEVEVTPIAQPKPSWLSPKTVPMVRDVEYDFSALQRSAAKQPKQLPAADEPLLPTAEAPLLAAKNPKNSADIVKVAPVRPTQPAELPKVSAVAAVVATPEPAVVPPVAQVDAATMSDLPASTTPSDNEFLGINKIAKADSGKPLMNDIMAKPKVYTPIDELRFFTLRNFRQLSPDPQTAIAAVIAKIQAIKEEDFSRTVEAINAWKQSPLNRMYLAVCTEALNAGQPAAKCLSRRRAADQEFLSEVEFEAIIKLNQNLSLFR